MAIDRTQPANLFRSGAFLLHPGIQSKIGYNNAKTVATAMLMILRSYAASSTIKTNSNLSEMSQKLEDVAGGSTSVSYFGTQPGVRNVENVRTWIIQNGKSTNDQAIVNAMGMIGVLLSVATQQNLMLSNPDIARLYGFVVPGTDPTKARTEINMYLKAILVNTDAAKKIHALMATTTTATVAQVRVNHVTLQVTASKTNCAMIKKIALKYPKTFDAEVAQSEVYLQQINNILFMVKQAASIIINNVSQKSGSDAGAAKDIEDAKVLEASGSIYTPTNTTEPGYVPQSQTERSLTIEGDPKSMMYLIGGVAVAGFGLVALMIYAGRRRG